MIIPAARRFALALAALLVAILTPAASHAAFGDRDCSFGSAGVANLPYLHHPNVFAVEADGGVVFRGYTHMTIPGRPTWWGFAQRISASGVVSPGVISGSDTPFGGTDAAIVALGNGSILVPAAMSRTSTSPPGPAGVVRVLGGGGVDSSFGSNGYASIAGFTIVSGGPVLQPDGRLLVGGVSSNVAAVARYNADGTPDGTFGTGGVASNAASGTAYGSIALDAPGNVVAVGGQNLARHLSSGALDTSFGASGNVALPSGVVALQVRVQPSGHIVVLTSSTADSALAVLRFDFTGTLVASRAVTTSLLPSGQNQLYKTDVGPGVAWAQPLHMMSDGKLLITGRAGSAWAIVRYDASVADDAQALLDFPPFGALVLPSGRIYVGADGSVRRLLGDADAATCTATTTTLASSDAHSAYGQAVTLTATVSASSGPAPTGTVHFNAPSWTRIGTLSGGVASLTRTDLPQGSYTMTATYVPTGTWNASTSAPVNQVVDAGITINDPTANSAGASPTMTFLVSLAGGTTNATVTVVYATADHTALAGQDYTATSGSLTFNPGETTKPVVVPVTPKGAPGASRDFYLALSSPTNAVLLKGAGIGTIVYSAQGSLAFYVDDPSVAEGPAGTTLLGFNVSLSQPHDAGPLTVEYATADSSAIAGADYTAQSGTLTFARNQTQRWVMVPVQGNLTVQANRQFYLNLSNPSGGVITKAQGVATIVDDDPTPAASTVEMLRLYSPVTKEHLYTTDANEYAILGTRDWVQEGSAFEMFASAGSYGAQYAIPLYRLYHPAIQQHHWTSDANEVMGLVPLGTWSYEGIAGYLLPAAGAGTTPLYRLMYHSPALHLWTTDLNEKDVLSTQYGWIYEGVVGEVLP